MRLTSEFFVSALIRRVFSTGDFAAVAKKGAAEAGAIFIRQRFRDGAETLFGPAPQSYFDEDRPSDRRFEKRLDRANGEDLDAMLERERRFDPDLWIIELELDDIGDLFIVAE